MLERLMEWRIAGVDRSVLSVLRLEWQRTVRLYASGPDSEVLDGAFNILVQVADASAEYLAGAGARFDLIDEHQVHLRAVEGQLEALRRSIDGPSSSEALTAGEIQQVRGRLRRQAELHHRYVTPPDFERQRRIPLADIYVKPRAEPVTADLARMDLRVDVDELLAQEPRLVVLGAPGAGKSTLAGYFCHQLSTATETDETHPQTAAVVVLRNAVATQQPGSFAVRSAIVDTFEGVYQVNVKSSILEHLLISGGLTVIFDGLDELLDATRRREVAAAIEAFGHAYPRVRILVTSRRVGYEQAPLDDGMFPVYRLTEFSEAAVEDYVERWFQYHAAEYGGTTPAELQRNFMHESRSVADLRSNALLLSLMCILYRGRQYIPRNRPDLYEECARLLFSDWDRHRRIQGETTFDLQTQFVLQHLATWIMSDRDRERGCTEADLVDETCRYFAEWVYDDVDVARDAARSLFTYCRGRSWILSEVGTTADGQGIWSFTHRTFLEYFAGLGLARSNPSIDGFAGHVAELLGDARFEVIAQIAVYRKAREAAGAIDQILLHLLERAPSGASRDRLIGFVCRMLQLVVPKPSTTTAIVEAAVARDLEQTARRESHPGFHTVGVVAGRPEVLAVSRRSLVGTLTRTATARSSAARLVSKLISSITAESIHHFQPSLFDQDPRPEYAEGFQVWQNVSREVLSEIHPVLYDIASQDAETARDLLRERQLSAEAYLELHDWGGLFAAERESGTAYIVEALNSLPNTPGLVGSATDVIESLGQAAMSGPPPYVAVDVDDVPDVTYLRPGAVTDVDMGSPLFVGVSIALCLLDELTDGEVADQIEPMSLATLDGMKDVLRGRLEHESEIADRGLRALDLPSTVKSAMRDWAAGTSLFAKRSSKGPPQTGD